MTLALVAVVKNIKKCCMIKSTVGYGPDEFLKSKIVQDLLEFSENNYKEK